MRRSEGRRRTPGSEPQATTRILQRNPTGQARRTCTAFNGPSGAKPRWKHKDRSARREVARTLAIIRDSHGVGGRALADAISLVGHKEEGFLFLDRAAKRSPKLILQIIEFRRIKKALGIEPLISEELIHVAMKIVGPGLCDHVHDRARIAAVFGVKRIRQHAEFLDAVG